MNEQIWRDEDDTPRMEESRHLFNPKERGCIILPKLSRYPLLCIMYSVLASIIRRRIETYVEEILSDMVRTRNWEFSRFGTGNNKIGEFYQLNFLQN